MRNLHFRKGEMKKSILVVLFLVIPIGAHADIAKQLDTVVVTASRIQQHNYKIAGNVTVITREEIEASNAQTIPDVLANVEGVDVFSYSTVKTSNVDIRGFGDTAGRNVLILVNDRKINPPDISGADLLQIPLDAVERIEIIRGAGSVLYGDNAVGGVVNIITKQGQGKLSGKLGYLYGSYDKQGVRGQVSGEKNNISYFLHSQYFDDRGYRQNSDVLFKDYNVRLGYKFADFLSTDFNAGWHQDRYGLPGGLNQTELNALGRRGTPAPNDTAFTKDRFANLTFDVNPWPKDFIDFGNFIIDFHYRNRDTYEEFNEFPGFELHTKRSTDTHAVTGRYIFDREVFHHEINFVAGLDYYDYETDILGSGASSDDLTISKTEFGAYTFLESELFEHFFLNGGTRYQSANYTFDQRNVPVFEKQKPTQQVSMAGAKYEYAKGSNLHFNVQQTFRFLATDEWYSSANDPGFGIVAGLNRDLEQQRGIQFEAGIKHNFDDAVEIDVTPYLMRLTHEIFFDPTAFQNSNYSHTRREGVEFGSKVDLLRFMKIKFLDGLELYNNYTWQNPTFEDGPNDKNNIPMVPRHQAESRLVATFLKHYNVSFAGHYVGARWAINDVSNGALHGTSIEKPYYVLDSKIAFKHQNLEIFATCNNILNRKYNSVVVKSAFSSTKDYYPAPTTNYTVGMDVKF